MLERKHALVLISGGIDSYACVRFLLDHKWKVTGLFVNYGQLAARHELKAATAIAKSLKIKKHTIHLDLQKKFGVGEVQGRNGLLAMAAYSFSSHTTRIIAMGIHGGTAYYDCSASFAERIDALIGEYSSGRTHFYAPFVSWSKGSVYQYFKQKKLNIDLAYSCEKGKGSPCRKCQSCKDRERFYEAG